MNQIVMHLGSGGEQTTSYALNSASIRPSSAELDQLFYTIMQLSNYADEHGLEDVAQHLENALDSLM